MNQILVTEKLYITPELKRKKKMYKFHFIMSIFLVCILTSLYIYAEYDRNKSEEVSQEILADFSKTIEEDNTIADNDILLVVLDATEEDYLSVDSEEKVDIAQVNQNAEVKKSSSGYDYKTIATINIPKINVNYSIVQGITGSAEETEALLKNSPVKYHGCEPNEVGNFCIVGHNYRNTKFFSKVPTLVNGDIIQIKDSNGKTVQYEVYDKYTVDPTDVSCTSQNTKGQKEITLITCTDDSKQRVIVKARAI